MNASTKTYADKSSAIRGAKRAGLAADTYTVEKQADGRYAVVEIVVAPVEVIAEVAAALEPVETPAIDTAAENMALAVEETAEKAAKKGAPRGPVIPMLRVSAVMSPTKLVWHIADELKGKGITRRCDVIAECVSRGIAFYTARTQYQNWKQLDTAASNK